MRTIDDVVELVTSAQIREHRHEGFELKKSWEEKHGEKISAFANKLAAEQVWLVIGVSDDGSLAGHPESWAKKTELDVSQHINNKLDPVQTCRNVFCRAVGVSWIVVIEIKNPGDVVYWGTKAFKAAGTSIAEMAPDEIMEQRFRLPGLTDYTRQPIEALYNSALVAEFATRAVERAPQDFVAGDNAALLATLRLQGTQAARLLFGDGAFRIVFYDRDGIPRRNEKRQGLYSILLPSLQEEIQAWSQQYQVPGATVAYPLKALSETLANAVAHAAYFENDGDVILEVYPDHMIASNLATRESQYFANLWFSRSHKTHNGLLMEALRVSGHVDELGRGKGLIFSESIRNGKRPPEVHLEPAGRVSRWRLTVSGGTDDEKQLRLLERVRNVYKDEQKSLIALALILWRDQKVEEIKKHVDHAFAKQFAEVLGRMDGPLWYSADGDTIVLKRWVLLLLGEGLDSKVLSHDEESRAKVLAYELSAKYHNGFMTASQLREWAELGNSPSDKTLASGILKKWCNESEIEKIKAGTYRWKSVPIRPTNLDQVIKIVAAAFEKRFGEPEGSAEGGSTS